MFRNMAKRQIWEMSCRVVYIESLSPNDVGSCCVWWKILYDEAINDTYISFTTYEARASKIGPMLSSLLDQWPANRVLLTVANDLELPGFIEGSGINIVRSADYGPFKKHSPLYMDLGIRQYIVVDDDCTFPDGWFDNLLRWSSKLPGHVVCGRGRIWRPAETLHYPNSKAVNAGRTISPVSCHIYIGLAGALFRVDFFEPDVFPCPET